MPKQPNAEEHLILQAGIPIRPEKIGKWDTVITAWSRMGSCYVQPKYDGWQIQIHKIGNNVRIFTKQLKDYTAKFSDIAIAAKSHIEANNAILEAEVVPYDPDEGELLPWKLTLKSMHHKAFAHDILHLNGTTWTSYPYEKRALKLQEVVKSSGDAVLKPVKDIFVTRLEMLQDFYDSCIEHGYEGVIVKKPQGIYKPGKKNSAKYKIKPIHSLDVIITGCQFSETGRLKSLKVAVRDLQDKLIDICVVKGIKIKFQEYLFRQVSRQFSQIQLFGDGWYSIQSEIVVEIECMFRIASAQYPLAGYYTLESARLSRFREDKGLQDIDTLADFFQIKPRPGNENLPPPR